MSTFVPNTYQQPKPVDQDRIKALELYRTVVHVSKLHHENPLSAKNETSYRDLMEGLTNEFSQASAKYVLLTKSST